MFPHQVERHTSQFGFFVQMNNYHPVNKECLPVSSFLPLRKASYLLKVIFWELKHLDETYRTVYLEKKGLSKRTSQTRFKK
jgi:hypothetical protein